MSKQEIRLKIIDDKIKVITPYNSKFVAKARNLRGKWEGGAWWFDDSLLDYVRETMIENFGTTGETPYETCTLLVTNYTESIVNDSVRLFERTIVVKPYSRDGYAKLGDGIILLSGTAHCGGSRNNPAACISKATFEIRDFPIPSLELPDVKAAIQAGWCEVKQAKKKKRTTAEIQADIDACKVRLEELENELINNKF
jgi:hypothetical protein